MKTSRFWSYFAKVGLGTGVAVALAGAPVVAHAEDNTPSGAIQRGSEATGRNLKARIPESSNAAANSDVPTGRRMNGAEILMNQSADASPGAASRGIGFPIRYFAKRWANRSNHR